MIEFGKATSDIGLSMNEAAKATTFIGSVLKQSGFSIAETSDLTETLVELGADLALTYGYDVQEALLGMTALFRGEYDPIEKFGVAMKQSEIDAEKAARGLDHLTGAAERYVDQQIRVEFLLERASDAMGAFERQSGNLTVQQMRLRAEFENVRDTVAADLLPIMASLTGDIREIVDDVGPKLEETFSNAAPVIEKLGEQIIPMLEGAVNGLIDAFNIVMGIIEEAQDPTTELGGSMEALGESFEKLFNSVSEDGPGADEIIESLAGSLKILADSLKIVVDTIDEHGDKILAFIGLIVAGRIGGGAAKALGKKNANVQTLEGIATNIGLIGAALMALPKGVFAMGLIGYILGEQIYGPLRDANEGILETSQNFDIATGSAEDFRQAFAATSAIRNNPYGVLAQDVKQTGDSFTLLGDDVTSFSDLFKTKTEETVTEQISFNNELTNGRIAANQLGLSDGLPTWLNGVKERTRQATEEMLDFKAATLQVLQLELRDLMRFGAAQEEIDSLQSTIAEMMKDPTGDDDGSGGGAGGAAKDYVGDFFAGIEEGIRSEAARLDLQELGLSQALIDQILGSQGWEEVFDAIIAGGKELAMSLQADFNQTAAGIQELADIAKAEAEALAAQAAAIAQLAQDAYNQASQAAAEHNAKVDELEQSVQRLTDSFKASQKVPSNLPPLQQEILDFTDTLRESIDSAEKAVLGSRNRETLQEFIDQQETAMLAVARMRDDLEAERSAIESDMETYGSIYDSLFESVLGTGRITSMGTSSRVIAARLERAIEDAKEFQTNLQDLRKFGLSTSLLEQIQQAGVEAGGATAEALIKGGPAAIAEINTLYGQLESTADVIGTQAADSMFDAGYDMMNGLLDGIIAQENQLAMAAEYLASTFSDTFNSALEEGTVRKIAPSLADFQGYYASKDRFNTFVAEEMLARGIPSIRYSPGDEVFGQIAPTPPKTRSVSNNITINAGVGTDGTELGRIVVDAIARYESTNGKVYADA
jgi:hypothetical protein